MAGGAFGQGSPFSLLLFWRLSRCLSGAKQKESKDNVGQRNMRVHPAISAYLPGNWVARSGAKLVIGYLFYYKQVAPTGHIMLRKCVVRFRRECGYLRHSNCGLLCMKKPSAFLAARANIPDDLGFYFLHFRKLTSILTDLDEFIF